MLKIRNFTSQECLLMKLIIQIPCKNEQDQLPETIRELPTHIEWIDIIEYQVIDDGSDDNTYEVAKSLGVHHIVRFRKNRGLGNAFKAGVAHALQLWADIVVNTDADNQYPWRYIVDLVKPILKHEADIVIGDRNPTQSPHFHWLKRQLQWLGNWVVGTLAWSQMPDSVSGFRAYSRESLYALNVTSQFSYVIDTIIQAHKKGLQIGRVPITTNPPTRPSRLFGNIWEHIKKSTANIIRVYTMYEPFKTFIVASLPFFLLGTIWIVRYFIFYFQWMWGGNIQSLVLSSLLMMVALNFFSLWVIGDVVSKNRNLIEENMLLTKKLIYDPSPAQNDSTVYQKPTPHA
jgi:glycosyltransferase involved in cell wall biosynthesis